MKVKVQFPRPTRAFPDDGDVRVKSQYSTERSPNSALLHAGKQNVILPVIHREECPPETPTPPPAQSGNAEQSLQQ